MPYRGFRRATVSAGTTRSPALGHAQFGPSAPSDWKLVAPDHRAERLIDPLFHSRLADFDRDEGRDEFDHLDSADVTGKAEQGVFGNNRGGQSPFRGAGEPLLQVGRQLSGLEANGHAEFEFLVEFQVNCRSVESGPSLGEAFEKPSFVRLRGGDARFQFGVELPRIVEDDAGRVRDIEPFIRATSSGVSPIARCLVTIDQLMSASDVENANTSPRNRTGCSGGFLSSK